MHRHDKIASSVDGHDLSVLMGEDSGDESSTDLFGDDRAVTWGVPTARW